MNVAEPAVLDLENLGIEQESAPMKHGYEYEESQGPAKRIKVLHDLNQGKDRPIKDTPDEVDAVTLQRIGDESANSQEFNNNSLSKSARKRQEKQKKWLENRPERRAKERARSKQKKMFARLNNISLGPSRNMLKKSTMAQSKCKIRVVMDLSFDDFMSEKDMGKCIKQLLRSYSLNRRAENPMQLYFTNLNGKCEMEMEKHEGFRNWDIYFHSNSYTEIFDHHELVYLTSDSDNVITTLDEEKVYIIGGIVDHNQHKGLCYRVAVDQKISHGQLPIKEFLEMNSRKVLTIDHVFEILLCVSGGMSWKDAFLKVLPPRKGAKEKSNSTGLEDSAIISCADDVDRSEETHDLLKEDSNLNKGTNLV